MDIVAVNQAGDTLLIEVKAGDVEFRPDGIFKRYGAETKDVTRQAGLQYGALRAPGCRMPLCRPGCTICWCCRTCGWVARR